MMNWRMRIVSEEDFYRLLIEMIKTDNHCQKNRIITLLLDSKLSFEKTWEYTRNEWNHYKEYIHILTARSNIVELNRFLPYLEKKIRQIYPTPNEYEYELFGIDIKPRNIIPNDEVSQEIHFIDIQNQILQEISNAKYLIWVAMAWFTNPVLYKALLAKKADGLNIQIIIDDNQKNKEAPFVLESDFETYRLCIRSLFQNIMHDKFCIIDLSTVIHGTFNWTNAANYNKETISIDRNPNTARKFADEFMKLKQIGS